MSLRPRCVCCCESIDVHVGDMICPACGEDYSDFIAAVFDRYEPLVKLGVPMKPGLEAFNTDADRYRFAKQHRQRLAAMFDIVQSNVGRLPAIGVGAITIAVHDYRARVPAEAALPVLPVLPVLRDLMREAIQAEQEAARAVIVAGEADDR